MKDWKLFDAVFGTGKPLDKETWQLIDNLIKSDLSHEELVRKMSEYLPPSRYEYNSNFDLR